MCWGCILGHLLFGGGVSCAHGPLATRAQSPSVTMQRDRESESLVGHVIRTNGGGGETGFPIGRVKKSTHLTASLCMFGIPNGHEEKEPSPECVTKIKNVCQSAVQENSVIYSYSTSCSTKDFLSILIGHLTRLFWNSLWNRFKLDLITNGGEQLNPEKFRYPC